jgi:hypothetical protein
MEKRLSFFRRFFDVFLIENYVIAYQVFAVTIRRYFFLEKLKFFYHRVALRRKAHVPRRYPQTAGQMGQYGRRRKRSFIGWT